MENGSGRVMSGERSLPPKNTQNTIGVVGLQANFPGPNLTATREVYCEMKQGKVFLG